LGAKLACVGRGCKRTILYATKRQPALLHCRAVNAAAHLWLGRRPDGAAVDLPASTLLRHVMALGSSGSGKTVFCKVVVEEAVRRGIPAICIDPQGDLASLAGGASTDEELEARGIDPQIAAELAERADVVVFTPGSERAIPLCADPIDPAIADREGDDRALAVSRTAAVVASLLGFDLEGDDGAGMSAVIDRVLSELLEGGARPTLALVAERLAQADDTKYARYVDARKLRLACQRAARLDVGARRSLFHAGVPIDIDVLLGRDPRAKIARGKTRIAVIYLNTLHAQEDKDFFVAALAERLYGWMLAHPSETPQLLFYIDEVAPFIPPVRKPACKDALALVFKQARKYGVACLMATQNPGDVDYRAMAQFGTWALGRLTTRQDLKKVEPTVKALAPTACDTIIGRLPALSPGQLVLLSPDVLPEPIELYTRWLLTRHETWNEERIEAYADRTRDRFRAWTERPSEPESESASASESESASESASASASETSCASAPESASVSEFESAYESESEPVGAGGRPALNPTASARASESEPVGAGGRPAFDRTASARASESEPVGAGGRPALDPTPARRGDRTDREILAALASHPSMSARELAAAIQRHEATVRRAIERLEASGEVRTFAAGRTRRHFSTANGGRPDLDLPAWVDTLTLNLSRTDVERLALEHARSRWLGMIGEDETFARAELTHKLAYRVAFEERVERSILRRIFGPTHDERVGTIYLHPHNLGVILFSNERGIRFDDLPEGPASDIADFDGVATIERVEPALLELDDADVRRRKTEREVRAHFSKRFDATPGAIDPLFVPLWDLYFDRAEHGGHRRLTIDGLVGLPVRWLPP
jgi:DNA-binding Lrp family transcriptional regulator